MKDCGSILKLSEGQLVCVCACPYVCCELFSFVNTIDTKPIRLLCIIIQHFDYVDDNLPKASQLNIDETDALDSDYPKICTAFKISRQNDTIVFSVEFVLRCIRDLRKYNVANCFGLQAKFLPNWPRSARFVHL